MMIKEITLEDVLNVELQERALTETETTALMKWWPSVGYGKIAISAPGYDYC